MIIGKSMAEYFKETKQDVEDRIVCGAGIFGTDSATAEIEDALGVNPSPLLFRQIKDSRRIHYGDKRDVPVTTYSLLETSTAATAFCLGGVAKDDLYLFACMAGPKLLNLPEVQQAFFGRLDALHAEEVAESTEDLTAAHEAETAELQEFVGYMEGAQESSSGKYYHHKDYSPDKEYPSLLEYQFERFKAEQAAQGVQGAGAANLEE